jgi:drug/metabolite transporter (DMT)-like permease
MGIVFGVLAAIMLGASDVVAAMVSRKVASIAVTRTALLASVPVALVGLLVVPSTWLFRDIVVGALSGIAMTTGLVFLYRAYSLTRVGIVAPTASVLTALIPVIVSLVRGDVPKWVAGAGMVLGLIGIGLATYEPRGTGESDADTTQRVAARKGLLLGLAAGFCFGFAFALLAETSNGSGLSSVVVQRLVGLAGLLLLGVWTRSRVAKDAPVAPTWANQPEVRYPAIAVGLLAGVGICFLKLGFRRGPDGAVAVAASQFATAAVVFAVLFTKERLRPIAGVGIACAAIGVAMMSLG